MSNSLHVASKYEVHYGSISSFKNKEDAFERLIDYMDIECQGDFPRSFEIYKEEWEDGIRILKDRKKHHSIDEDLVDILKDLGTDISTLIELLEEFQKQSDPNNDYIIFSFF